MLTTQISGLLQRIGTANEESIEETARLLAQATSGVGRVIIAGSGEMTIVCSNALNSAEPFSGVVQYENDLEIGSEDRVWILTRNATDEQALQLAHELANRFIPFAAVASEKPDDSNELAALATTYISIGLTQGLLPGNDDERIVQPHALAALFIYEAVKVAYDEMLSDD